MPSPRHRRPRGRSPKRTRTRTPPEVSTSSPHLWLVGRIGRPVGLAGECVIHSISSDPDDLVRIAEAPVRMAPEGEDPAALPTIAWEGLRFHSARAIGRFGGIESREAIAERTHWSLWVDRRDLPPLEVPDTWWVDDLVGCRVAQVSDGDADDLPLGEVISVIDGPANDYLEVRAESGRCFNLPLVKRFLVEVDLARQIIRVDLPEGLAED